MHCLSERKVLFVLILHVQDQCIDSEVLQLLSEVAARDFDTWMSFLLVFFVKKDPSSTHIQIKEFTLVPQANLDLEMHRKEVECLLVKSLMSFSVIKQLKRTDSCIEMPGTSCLAAL